MDSSRKQKILKVGIDRLSSLPDDLIHKILSFIGTKHVVQTSALSSRWKYTWTSMPYLDFSSDDFANFSVFSKFVTHVQSGRNNVVQVSSLKLILSLTCSQRYGNKVYFNTWELPALTTLHLDNVILSDDKTEKDIGVFSKCANLKSITLKNFKTRSSNGVTICNPELSNLILEDGHWCVKVVNVVAPKLENLTINKCSGNCHFRVSAPNLTSFVCKGYDPFHIDTDGDGFPVLDKADLYLSTRNAKVATRLMCLLQQLQSVKSLTLSFEIVELLSSHTELISRQPYPFSNLKSLAIYPIDVSDSALQKEKVTMMSSELKSYLLDSSPNATFKMVFPEEVIATKRMAELQVLLDKDKVNIETSWAQIGRTKAPTKMRWKNLNRHFNTRKSKACLIISKLKPIKKLLKRIPASNIATILPSYANLCAEADFVMSKITDYVKNQFDEDQSSLSIRFHNFASTLQPQF